MCRRPVPASSPVHCAVPASTRSSTHRSTTDPTAAPALLPVLLASLVLLAATLVVPGTADARRLDGTDRLADALTDAASSDGESDEALDKANDDAGDGPAADTSAEPSLEGWAPIGLIRVRDLTPFGLARLDFQPPYAVQAPSGTWAIETQMAWQNTFVLSDNVVDYLESRGDGRRALTPEDVEAIQTLGGDAYIVDGELGLVDLTVHAVFSKRWSGYVTLPVFFFGGGFADSSIENFHDSFGFSSAQRDLVPRDRFQFAFRLGDTTGGRLDAPSSELGDPTFGLRWASESEPWNLILEAAVKPSLTDTERFTSTGNTDYGVQATVQRRFRRNALYATASLVDFGGVDNLDPGIDLIPTVILGWETRVRPRTSFVLQFYASRSVVQNTTIEDLSDNKYQVVLGLVGRSGSHAWNIGLIENVSNFSNTPDVGLAVGWAWLFDGR